MQYPLKVYDVRFDDGSPQYQDGNYGLAFVLARTRREAEQCFEAANPGIRTRAVSIAARLEGVNERHKPDNSDLEARQIWKGSLW